MKTLKPDHPALSTKHTIFLKQVKAPDKVARLLQPASTNGKLGKGKTKITKGKWKGMPMYQLSLEERKTCPTTCEQWSNCYGNNMPFANRIDHTHPLFFQTLTSELKFLSTKHASGFVVRLHVLGDFFNVKYVKYWERKLRELPSMRLFGYTHQKGKIGEAIEAMNSENCWIRFSDRGGLMSANTDKPDGTLGEGLHCPEQRGLTESCLTCGLCFQTDIAIRFSTH